VSYFCISHWFASRWIASRWIPAFAGMTNQEINS
jgi:hypothetical protein